MSRNAFEEALQEARLRRIEQKLDDVLYELRARPLVAFQGLQNDCGCPPMTTCNSVACPRAIHVTSTADLPNPMKTQS